MRAHELGFMSSWRMLTRDKGWIKPVLVLTLVSWIPILGQIALLGYGLEWARLTAWGVDSAPKQGSVDYGKVLSTGGRAFLVTLSMGFAIGLLLQIVFPGSIFLFLGNSAGAGAVASYATVSMAGVASILLFVMMSLSGTFVNAASLRATIYDSFGAGWNLSRLCQMVGRDVSGFFKTFLVWLIGAAIQTLYAIVTGFIGMIALMGGVMGVVGIAGMSGYHSDEYILHQLLNWGAGPALLFVVCALIVAFIGGVIATAMNLVAMNAVGQWFCRFDVNRWGVSSAPLPEGVPHVHTSGAASTPTNPVPPIDPLGAQTPAAGAGEGFGSTADAAPSAPAQPAAPQGQLAEPAASQEQPTAEPTAAIPMPPVSDGHDRETVGDVDPAAAGPESVEADAEVAVEVEQSSVENGVAEPEVQKKPIPLGPISSDDASSEEGPISV